MANEIYGAGGFASGGNQSKPNLRKVSSTRYAIGWKVRSRKKIKRLSQQNVELNQPLLADQEENESKNLCNLTEDLKAVKHLFIGSYVNLLLIFVPFGCISYAVDWNESLTFFLNFAGMIPIAAMLGDATEELAHHLGDTIGGLLSATFGNAVEIVVMIMALAKAKSTTDPEVADTLLNVVQTSLIGSIFSNSLLVLGCAFLANGIKFKQSSFNVTATSANVSLLMISAFIMLLPGPYANSQDDSDALAVSRVIAFILIGMYICLTIFVLVTHADIMNPEEEEEQNKNLLNLQQAGDDDFDTDDDFDNPDDDNKESNIIHQEEFESEPEPELSLFGSMTVLLISTIVVAVLSEFLVDSIQPMARKLNMSDAFVGIILLPIIGNAVEHITAIKMAIHNKMDIALGIAIGSATQVAMFVVGLAIIIAWGMDLDLSLAFDPFEVQLFIYSSIIIFALVADGESNWLEGVMLLGLYLAIAVAVWDQQNYSRFG